MIWAKGFLTDGHGPLIQRLSPGIVTHEIIQQSQALKAAGNITVIRTKGLLLDGQGRVVETFARLQWDIHDVLNHAKARFLAGSNLPKNVNAIQ